MSLKRNTIFASISLFFTIITIFPTLGLLLAILLVYNYKIIFVISLLGLTYNIGKIVKYYYDKQTSPIEKELSRIHDNDEVIESIEHVEIGDGFQYSRKDDVVNFTFRNVRDSDGRQVARLKFMRKQFFKD